MFVTAAKLSQHRCRRWACYHNTYYVKAILVIQLCHGVVQSALTYQMPRAPLDIENHVTHSNLIRQHVSWLGNGLSKRSTLAKRF
jgi:hypothetical protein